MAWMTEQEIVENFSSDIDGVVADWFWNRADAISELQKITEIEDDKAEVIIQFWSQVQNEGKFLDTFFDNENSWMEKGTAYTMNSEGEFESWDNPYNNY